MSTWLITHPVFLEHDTGPDHPESPERLRAILDRLSGDEFAALERHEAEPASTDEIARVHDSGYIERVLAAVPESGYRSLDADTIISPRTGEAALRAAGALRQAVDAVMTDQARRVFCAVRPPGHHAEWNHAMGFCLFNNIAVGAAHARAVHNVQRVAIIDFDVHHGNGTQHILAGKQGYLYCSTHQYPLFPGSGSRPENISGSLLNVPLLPGSNSDDFREHFSNEITRELMRFEPDLIMISAGFDAHRNDPLAQLELTERDYAWATEELVSAADYLCGGRIVSTLEGGYNLKALAESTAVHVQGLMDAA